jgi:hypothetical protein
LLDADMNDTRATPCRSPPRRSRPTRPLRAAMAAQGSSSRVWTGSKRLLAFTI